MAGWCAVLTAMDLDALILPCPKGSTRFRPQVLQQAGKMQFPYLVDDNTGTSLLESADIIDCLRRTYGGRGPQRRGWRRNSPSPRQLCPPSPSPAVLA